MSIPTPATFFGGLDLGQMAEYSALCVVERAERIEGGERVRHHAVRHLHRWPLRTPYPAIVRHVVALFARPPLAGSALCVDRTAVGVAVTELLTAARPEARLVPVSVSGGAQTTCGDGGWSVPKRELAGVLQVLLGTHRLKVSPRLPLAKVLAREMGTFKVKVNIAPGAESFEAWRERDHDDLVLATALACWYGERDVAFEVAQFVDVPTPRPERFFLGSAGCPGLRRRLLGR